MQPDVETAAYRIIQEALNNVAKHAGAHTCCVRLKRTPTGLHLTIEDDGRGFDPEAVARGGARRGLGLIGIRERVTRLRGAFTLESSSETGTRLHVELPA
jgi:signal transduction histidine kinase